MIIFVKSCVHKILLSNVTYCVPPEAALRFAYRSLFLSAIKIKDAFEINTNGGVRKEDWT